MMGGVSEIGRDGTVGTCAVGWIIGIGGDGTAGACTGG